MGGCMEERLAQRIEGIVIGGSAAILAVAAAFAAAQLSATMLTVGAVAVSVLSAALLGLRSIGSGQREFSLARFNAAELAFDDLDELLLTDSHRFDPASDELVLEDVLVALEQDSRVVRLFDASAMPTPAELRTRIDRHLGQKPGTELPDASAALHEALTELRQSLR